MKTFDVFDPTLNVHKPFLLEASAGTGKTFSIENIVVRALLEDPKDGNALSIKDILVVTFTKAAAKDLKVRILQNLQKTSKKEIPAESLQRVKRALVEFDMANISTIHAFCYRALAEHATVFRLNKDPEDFTSENLWRVIEKYFRTELTKEAYTPKQLNILLKPHQNNITELTRALIKIQKKGTCFAKTHPNEFYLKLLEEGLLILKGHESIFESYAYNYYGLCEGKTKTLKKSFKTLFHAFVQLIEIKPLHMEHLNSILEEIHEFIPLYNASNLKKSGEKPPCDILNIFSIIQERLLPALRALGNYENLFARLGAKVQTAIFKEFEDSETCDFSYLLIKMHQLISEDNEFKNRLKSRYQMVIIDEFQDTDPLQWKIFKELFSSDGFPFILVGDPKQSIYAFRSADIYTYLNAAQTIDPEYQFLLRTNYRSSQDLISGLNHLFNADHAPGWISLPYLKTHLPYIPVHSPSAQMEDRVLAPAIHFLHALSSETLHLIEEKYFFPKFLQEVRQLQKEKGIPLSEIAFLVRDHLQSDRLFHYFQTKGLSSSQKKTLNIDKAIILQDLIYLLRAIHSPKNFGAIQIALGTQFFRWTTVDLKILEDQDQLSAILLYFNQWNEIWKENGIASLIEAVLSSLFLNVSIQEALLSSYEGLKRYHELRQLMEWLSEKESIEKIPPSALIEILDSLDGSEHPLRPLIEKEAVSILTLHMSKGLEFDVVFALGVINRPPVDKGLILIREDENMALKAIAENDPSYMDFLEENDAEKSRQLYVALTRARLHVYIPYIEGWKPPPLGSASPLELWLARIGESQCPWIELYTRLKSFNVEKLLNLIAASKNISIETLSSDFFDLSLPASPLPELVAPIEIVLQFPKLISASFSGLIKHSLTSKQRIEATPRDFTCEDKSLKNLPAGASTGELLHQILENIPFSLLQDERKIKDFISHYTLKTSFEAWENALSEMIYQAFQTPLLNDLSENTCFREMEFIYPAELAHHLPECRELEGLIKGVVDLFFIKDGKYYLLDWKSNWLPSYTQNDLKEAMITNRYDLQASLYKNALKIYLSKVDMRPFDEIYGGTIYCFLRGNVFLYV